MLINAHQKAFQAMTSNPLGEVLKAQDVVFIPFEGELHLGDLFRDCREVRYSLMNKDKDQLAFRSPGQREAFFKLHEKAAEIHKFADIPNLEICYACLLAIFYYEGRTLKPSSITSWELISVASFYTSKKKRLNTLSNLEGISSVTIQRRINEIEKDLISFSDRAQTLIDPSLNDELYQLQSSFEKLLPKLKNLFGGDSVRQDIAKQVRKRLFPESVESLEVELDESLRVIGLANLVPQPGHKFPNLLPELIAAYRVGAGVNTILLVPAYFESVIFAMVRKSPLSPALFLSAPAPEQKVIETAASLWAPFDNGPLASLVAAIKAAQALEG